MKRIVILTGSELRHRFMRKAIALDHRLAVTQSYCEGLAGSLTDVVAAKAEAPLQQAHLEARGRSEDDFFSAFDRLAPDKSNPVEIARGTLGECTEGIVSLAPDLIVAYGCSIVRQPLLSEFPKRIINLHLGLSPYYKGGGTNFWPLVNGEPEMVGATFMFMDAGIDTGEIIHQVRARIFPNDTPHQIGNRLISDCATVFSDLIARFDEITSLPQPQSEGRTYRMKDLTEDSVRALYQNFGSGMIEKYLDERSQRESRAPIVRQAALS